MGIICLTPIAFTHTYILYSVFIKTEKYGILSFFLIILTHFEQNVWKIIKMYENLTNFCWSDN